MPFPRTSLARARNPLGAVVTSLLTAVVTAVALLIASLPTAAPAHAAASDIVSMNAATRASDAQNLLSQINAHRASKGLKAVKYSATLSGISQGQSDRLVQQEVINHSNTFLTDRRAGAYTAVGEIHALSWQHSVTDLVTWWKGSTAHNKVLTDPKMQVIGIGLTYVDGGLAGNGQGWRLVGTVDSYGYANGGGPADARTTVTAAAAQATKVAPATPAKASYTVRGGIKTRYTALGGAAVFGVPTTNERGGLVNGGVYQNFRTSPGAVFKFLWSPASGAHAVKETGAIGRAWKSAGYERGWGYPTTEEYGAGSEVRQRFSNGYTAHWSRVNGRTWVTR
ncbi:hypothetical protein KVA01_02950 [Kocuria varians]|uniref:SCP domain-containing protein n=1 Tax=Kocuria varians TaxID=1272 RepID=A0A4Y4D5U4_KOCVA|nr:CAP domain-containing protein [Kocuria varians]GEC98140.1 hypothetical protein KVA01_02950 [Kocuria varians]